MNARFIAYLIITLNYRNYTNGVNSRIDRTPIMKCYSVPELRILYNTTVYTSYTSIIDDINNKPVHCDKYKSIIHNKYRRNIYLRSIEKYKYNDKK